MGPGVAEGIGVGVGVGVFPEGGLVEDPPFAIIS